MKYIVYIVLLAGGLNAFSQTTNKQGLHFSSLAKRWDEAIPLGNGWLGALIWEKNEKVRLSLDRVDLWDDRPMPDIDKLTFKWVMEKVKLNQYDSVHKLGDEPYEKYPAPSKIPGAAIEFDLKKFGEVISNDLDISNGLSVVKFESGLVFNNYIHAVNQVGYFGFENVKSEKIIPELIVPGYYSKDKGIAGNSLEGQSLQRLEYKQGTVTRTANSIRYHQPTWKNNYYEVLIVWQKFPGNKIIGQWTISNNKPAQLSLLNQALKEPTNWPSHLAWWNNYWNKSSVSIPDEQLQWQYDMEMYKFACVARNNTPPISLQAIWTADDGKLPPWKGDYHHDLNTELSYWPGYSGNHLELTEGFTNWLWKVKEENYKWSSKYFGNQAFVVPGVTTISGKAMGGWVQYSASPTTAAWLSQHFYWQWKYSMDEEARSRAFNYADEVFPTIADFEDQMYRKKEFLSSSPEYHDNTINAWFKNFTSYDLALINYSEKIIRESDLLFEEFGKNYLFADWYRAPYPINETGFMIAPGQNLDESHRHHAHLMAIHPLGLFNVEDEEQHDVIKKSLRHLEKMGTRAWCGYSFSWAACIYARAKEADNAAKQLKIFASNFVSSNSFHLNGDQKGGQYSDFTYRPFTLEGNFAFAQGVHEMLLQSHKGYIEVFPAVPDSWKDVSFKTLRTEGALLVSADKYAGVIDNVKITATVDGELAIKIPLKRWFIKETSRNDIKPNGKDIVFVKMKKGETITFQNPYE